MQKNKDIDKAAIIRAVITTIESEKEPQLFETRYTGKYGTPEKIKLKDGNREFIPDLAVHYDAQVDLYEIELEDKIDVEKWRQMALYAKNLKGHLFLVVPDYLCEKVKNKIKTSEINMGLIYFNTG